MDIEGEWSAWVDGLCVARGNGGSGQSLYYARQYADEGEVIVREGFSRRGKIAFRVGLKKEPK